MRLAARPAALHQDVIIPDRYLLDAGRLAFHPRIWHQRHKRGPRGLAGRVCRGGRLSITLGCPTRTSGRRRPSWRPGSGIQRRGSCGPGRPALGVRVHQPAGHPAFPARPGRAGCHAGAADVPLPCLPWGGADDKPGVRCPARTRHTRTPCSRASSPHPSPRRRAC